MKNPIRRRLLRELRQDLGRYLSLFLFLALTVGFCSAMDVAGASMLHAYHEGFEKYHVEDGHFRLEKEADPSILDSVRASGAEVYELFYKDKVLADGDKIRIFVNRDQVDLPCLWEGHLPEKEDEIVLDRLYALKNGRKVGDVLEIEGKKITICGMVALSDYSTMFENNSDTMFSTATFSIALMTREGFEGLGSAGLAWNYAWTWNDPPADDQEAMDRSDDLMEAIIHSIIGMSTEKAEERGEQVGTMMGLFEMISGAARDRQDQDLEGSIEEALEHFIGTGSNELEDFVPRQINQAINFTGDDIGSDKMFTELFLIILIVILAFIFAVTVRGSIEKEASVIGTLRASGMTRGELLAHYMTLPMAVTAAGAIAGNILGYTCLKYLIVLAYYNSYSLPVYTTVWSGSAFVKTTVIPFFLILIVNLVILRSALSRTPLQFLRHDLSRARRKGAVRLPRWPFMARFRARILLQNVSSFLILFIGILLAGIMMAFGLMLTPMLDRYRDQVLDSQIAPYQVILKEGKETRTPGAEKFALTGLENEREGVTVYGITEDSAYLPDLDFGAKGDRIYISSAYAQKYSLGPGDFITLHEKYGENAYSMEVGEVWPYEASLSVWMSLDHYREVFKEDEDFFTGWFSGEEITDIDERDIATVITDEDLTILADQLQDSMGAMFPMFSAFAVIFFVLLIYLLTRQVIDRNERSISMMRILGYTPGEINRLYSLASAIAAGTSLVISLPVSYFSLDLALHAIMTRYNGWITVYVAPWIYGAVLGLGAVSFGFVYFIEMRRIARVPMAEALKQVN